MKKLMLIATVLVMGCSLNAASYTWGFQSAETKAPDGKYFGDTGSGYADASAFLFLGSSVILGGTLDISALTQIAVTTAMNPDPYYNWGVFNTGSMPSSNLVTTDAGQAYTLILVAQGGLSSLVEGTEYEMLVVNGTSKIASILGTEETTKYADFTNDTVFGQTDWKSATIGSNVPEPTSGLLLLIGMAGLALKRKRA